MRGRVQNDAIGRDIANVIIGVFIRIGEMIVIGTGSCLSFGLDWNLLFVDYGDAHAINYY